MKDKVLWSIIKTYRFRSLFFRNLIIIFCTVFFSLAACTTVILYTYRDNTQKSLRDFYTNKNYSMATETENVLKSIKSNYETLCVDSNITNYLTTEKYALNIDLSADISKIYASFRNIIMSSSYIDSIYLYKSMNGYVFSDRMAGSSETFADMGWYSDYMQENTRDYVKYRTVSFYGMQHNYITVCETIYWGTKSIGVLVFNIDADALGRQFGEMSNDACFSVTDTAGNVIYSTEADKINTAMDISGNAGAEKSVIMVKKPIRNNTYYAITSYNGSVTFSRAQFYLIMLILLLAVLAGAVIVSYHVTNKFYSSVLNIIHILQSNDTSQEEYNDEYQYISSNILKIKNTQSQYEAELAKQLTQLKKSQLDVLQEQINPHFIFNTLNFVSLMDASYNKGGTDISRVIVILSRILRRVLDTGSNIVAFSDEIEYLDMYMKIQNMRYKGDFEFRKEIEEDTLNLSCVKFMLQPIAENSVKHGILNTDNGKGTIVLSSKRSGDNFVISIKDNGVGMDEGTLALLRENLEKNMTPTGNHIGLLNVNARVKLLFGDDYGCRIDSSSEGTCVSVVLPAIEYTAATKETEEKPY